MNIDIHIEPNTHAIYAIRLVPGKWKEIFSKGNYAVLIAECLNECVYENDMHINGYLITYNSVCLLLSNDIECQQKITLFMKKVKTAVLEVANKHEREKIVLHHLFRQYTITDTALIYLLTGRDFQLPYYDPNVSQLREKLNNEPFCSVVDYSGAKSPVVIEKKEPKIEIIITSTDTINLQNDYFFNTL
ncbi:hypothetical protein GCM10007424_19100 [Flavobacterium suaedae]|uniref:Uncharacterized protein n=1 Tax=Flavobacterium suaedae TaxID=1767027 RepID=A0ABQ1K071_9FLAO|nr:hypothetical protein [Flavobacterium suaedae]GGB79122.1 hypothetical protein GCM10007424_19100 [Flavobacterium suaedae]